MNLTWPLAMVICIGMICLTAIIWFEYRKKDEKNKPFTNPFMVAVVGGIALSLTVFVMEAIEVLPPDYSKDHPWIFIVIFAFVFLASATYLRYLKPKTIDQLKDIVIERLWKDGNAKIYSGSGSRDPWIAYEVVETNDQTKIFNKVVNFLVLAIGVGNKSQKYLLTLDLIDGKSVFWRPNPSKELIEKKFDKDVTANLDMDKILAEKAFVGEGDGETTAMED